MPDFRTMFDSEYVGSWDLEGRDVTVTIARVEAKRIKSDRGEVLKPILHFEGKQKPMICNKTNGKTIANLYSAKTEAWIGKRITLYPTTTTAGAGGTVDCIRVRPTAPPPPEARR